MPKQCPTLTAGSVAPQRPFASVSKSNKADEMRHEVTSFICDWKDAGGGVELAEDDIAVLELPFDKPYEMTEKGEIIDGKTIMLLQYAAMWLLNKQDK
jgi:hypothetical protein